MKNNIKTKNKDPFAGCVLAEKARRGEWFEYSYTPNGLPKWSNKSKSVLGWSPFLEKRPARK